MPRISIIMRTVRALPACFAMVWFDFIRIMKTSWHGNTFRITGHLWGESTGHRWIPLTNDQWCGLWCSLWCQPKRSLEQTVGLPVIWNAMTLKCHVYVYFTGIGPMIKLYDCSRASEVTLKNIDRFNLSQEKTMQQNIYTTVTDHKHIWWDIRVLLREITRAQVSYVIQYPANIPCKHSEMGWARTLAFLLPRPGTRDQYHGWLCPDSLCRQVTSKMVLTM